MFHSPIFLELSADTEQEAMVKFEDPKLTEKQKKHVQFKTDQIASQKSGENDANEAIN